MVTPWRGFRSRLALLFALTLAGTTVLQSTPASAARSASADHDFIITITADHIRIPTRRGCYPTDIWINGGRATGHWLYKCGDWEWINASMSVEGRAFFGWPVRNLGSWYVRRPYTWDRTENWTDQAQAAYPAFIGSSNHYLLKDRPLCETYTYKECVTNKFSRNSNVLQVFGKYGDTVRFAIHIQDIDGQLDCNMSHKITWTEAMVKKHTSANKVVTLLTTKTPNGNTLCEVGYTSEAREL